jgi:predicted RNase H-like HicB family nuclease
MIDFEVVLIPAEEGGYTVVAPALPGCISEGDTEEEALENIKDAIQGWLVVAKRHGLYVPDPDGIKVAMEGWAPQPCIRSLAQQGYETRNTVQNHQRCRADT